MRRLARACGNGAGCPWRLEAPGMSLQTCRIAASNSSRGIMLAARWTAVGFRYGPGFRTRRMNSTSFLITPFGSYGFPSAAPVPPISVVAFAIFSQKTVARPSNPSSRRRTRKSA